MTIARSEFGMRRRDGFRVIHIDEVATTFRVSRRTMHEYVRKHPFSRLFTRADIKALYEALKCPSSSSEDQAVRTGTSTEPSEASAVRESTGVADQKAAEAIRARREWEIIQRSVFGRGGDGNLRRSSRELSRGGRRADLSQADHRADRLDAAGEDRSDR